MDEVVKRGLTIDVHLLAELREAMSLHDSNSMDGR